MFFFFFTVLRCSFKELHCQVGKTYTDYKNLSSNYKIYVRKNNWEIITRF